MTLTTMSSLVSRSLSTIVLPSVHALYPRTRRISAAVGRATPHQWTARLTTTSVTAAVATAPMRTITANDQSGQPKEAPAMIAALLTMKATVITSIDL